MHHGIGVFIWATGSEEDLTVEADEPVSVVPTTGARGNRSAGSA